MAGTPFPFRFCIVPLSFVSSGKKLESLSITAIYAVALLLSDRHCFSLATQSSRHEIGSLWMKKQEVLPESHIRAFLFVAYAWAIEFLPVRERLSACTL